MQVEPLYTGRALAPNHHEEGVPQSTDKTGSEVHLRSKSKPRNTGIIHFELSATPTDEDPTLGGCSWAWEPHILGNELLSSQRWEPSKLVITLRRTGGHP